MKTMQISLSHQWDAYVRENIASGLYADEADVIEDALKLKQEMDAAKRQKLLDAIEPAWQQAERGSCLPLI